MAKSYVPQMLAIAQKLLRYMIKHQATVFQYVTDSASQTAYTNCVSCLENLTTLIIRARETP